MECFVGTWHSETMTFLFSGNCSNCSYIPLAFSVGLLKNSFRKNDVLHLETFVFCCLSGRDATKVASDMDETLPLENPGEAIQAAKAAAVSLEVPDTQPRPDLDDVYDSFSDAMPNETWLPKDEPDVGDKHKAWLDPNIKE